MILLPSSVSSPKLNTTCVDLIRNMTIVDVLLKSGLVPEGSEFSIMMLSMPAVPHLDIYYLNLAINLLGSAPTGITLLYFTLLGFRLQMLNPDHNCRDMFSLVAEMALMNGSLVIYNVRFPQISDPSQNVNICLSRNLTWWASTERNKAT